MRGVWTAAATLPLFLRITKSGGWRRSPELALLVLLTLPILAGESQLVLEGSSNLAPWRCRSTIVQIEDANLAQFHLRVPVTAFRCGNAKMERDMYRSLRAETYPSIEFRLTDVIGEVREAGGRYSVEGTLSLAGATRQVRLDIEAQRIAPDRYRLRARLPLRMTDFRITPPTAMFGVIKARDELSVRFDVVVGSGGRP